MRKRLRVASRGAVVVEFAIVSVPLCLAFFSIAQVSMIYAAKIVMRHAAIAAVRAHAVINCPNPGNNGAPTADPTNAGIIALGPWYSNGGNSISSVNFQFNSSANTTAPSGYFQLDTVTVTGTYVCTVPLGSWAACQGGWQWWTPNPGGTFTVPLGPYVAQFPHQGARYRGAGGACP
jgi:Flp pilus assembly protein TadG